MADTLMKRLLILLSVIAIAGVPASAAGTSKKAIKIAGTTEGNTGCMILEESTPVKGKLLLAGVVYVRTEYRVIQSFNYQPAKQKYTGPGAVKKLNRQAVRDKVKLVVLPYHYPPAQLTRARKLCGQ